MNFGFMELMVLVIITVSLIVSHNIHSPAMLAGSLFGIYSYILKFASGLDTIPYTVQRLSSLTDIAKRIELGEEGVSETVEEKETAPYRITGSKVDELKISA